jgi:hypothetical protein
MLSDPMEIFDTGGICIVSELISITIFLNLFSLVELLNCLGVKPSAFISSSTPSLKRGSIGKSSVSSFHYQC